MQLSNDPCIRAKVLVPHTSGGVQGTRIVCIPICMLSVHTDVHSTRGQRRVHGLTGGCVSAGHGYGGSEEGTGE